MAKIRCKRTSTSTHTRASAPRPSHLRRRNYPALSLVELLIGLSLGAVLLTAIATALQVMSSNLRANQAQLLGIRAAKVAMDFATTQLRQADECFIVATPANSGDPIYTAQTTEIKIIAGGGAARADSAAGDYVEVHLQTFDLGGGRTGLKVWKDTKGLQWNGATFIPSQTFSIPNITSAKILCELVGGPDPLAVQAVSLQLTLGLADQHGQTVSIPMTSSVTIRRSGT